MFATAALAILAVASVAVADPTPLEPSPGSVFRQGQNCTTTWTPDATGTWTTMNIELMTGGNIEQFHLKTVATLDGTDVENHSFSYPCLEVTPNSAIYFYKFSSPSSATVLFTTRFTIADATGGTTEPNMTETATGGEVIRWGIGALVDPSQGDEPPVVGTGSSNSSTPTAAPPSGNTAGSQTRTRTSTSATSASTNTSTNSQPGSGFRTLPLGALAAAILGAVGGGLLL